MKLAGVTLIAMAWILHFSACDWVIDPSRDVIVPFLPFVHPRVQVSSDIPRIAFLHLMVPLALVMAGVGLIHRGVPEEARRKAWKWLGIGALGLLGIATVGLLIAVAVFCMDKLSGTPTANNQGAATPSRPWDSDPEVTTPPTDWERVLQNHRVKGNSPTPSRRSTP